MTGQVPSSFLVQPVGERGLPSVGPIIPQVDILLYFRRPDGSFEVFLPRRADASLAGLDLPLPGMERQGFKTVAQNAVLAGLAKLGLTLDEARFRALAGHEIELLIGGKAPKHLDVRVLAYEVNNAEREAIRLSPDLEGRWFALDEARNPRIEMHPALRLVLQRLWGVLYFAGDFQFAHEDDRRRIVEAKCLNRTVGEDGVEVDTLVARSTVIHTAKTLDAGPAPDDSQVLKCLVHGCLRLGDHYHPHDEMFIVLQGQVTVFLASHNDPANITGPWIFTAGQAFTVSAYAIHTVFCGPDTLLSAIVTWDMSAENLISAKLVIPGIDTDEELSWSENGFAVVEKVGTAGSGQYSTDGGQEALARLGSAVILPTGGVIKSKPGLVVGVIPVDPGGLVGLKRYDKGPIAGWWYPRGAMGFGAFEVSALRCANAALFTGVEGIIGPNQLRQLGLANLMWPGLVESPLAPQQQVVLVFGLMLTWGQLAQIDDPDLRWFSREVVAHDAAFHPHLADMVRAIPI